MKTLKHVFILLKKDLLAEMRTKELFTSMFLFIFLSTAVFNFAFAGEAVKDELFTGIIWATFVFASVLGLNRSFVHEKDKGCLEGLMLSPMDRSSIYFGKAAANFVFLILIQVISIPVFSLFFDKYILFQKLPGFIGILLLGSFGISAVGTLLAAITVNTRARELLLPVLLFPVLVPSLIGSVKLTRFLLLGDEFIDAAYWVKLLAVYDIIFLLVAFLTFEYVIEE